MIHQGRIICNSCGCEMGVLHVPTEQTLHFCPDCTASGSPVDVIGPQLTSVFVSLVKIGLDRARLHEALRPR